MQQFYMSKVSFIYKLDNSEINSQEVSDLSRVKSSKHGYREACYPKYVVFMYSHIM